MNAAAQRRLTPVLAGIALALAGLLLVLFVGVGRGVSWLPPQPADPLPPQRSGVQAPSPRPLNEYVEVWQQPLFSPDRKPVVRAVDGGGSLGDMQLTGIILTPALHMALLYDKQAKHDVRVREGSAMSDGGWTLVELKPRSAVFDNAGSRTELNLPAGAPIEQLPGQSDAASAAPGPAGPGVQWQQGGPPVAGPAAATSEEAIRAERIRQLKAAVEKRRREQSANQPPQGVR